MIITYNYWHFSTYENVFLPETLHATPRPLDDSLAGESAQAPAPYIAAFVESHL